MLYTEEEALAKTRLGTSTFRRYLRLWEEIHWPLPTDLENRKLVGDTLLTLLEKTDDTRRYHRGNMTERLEDYMDACSLADIAEDYANSGARLRGATEFLFNMLRLAARRGYHEAYVRHLDSVMKILDLQMKVSQQEKAIEELREQVRQTALVDRLQKEAPLRT